MHTQIMKENENHTYNSKILRMLYYHDYNYNFTCVQKLEHKKKGIFLNINILKINAQND